MKCLILAGGKGNSLWPLSREEYPKQFMEIKENRSLLQETIARNIPYCDEFLIVTNQSYHFIVESQMKAFRGLKYRCILEEVGRKTGPAVAMTCMALNLSELVYVVSADQVIEGEDYKDTVIKGQRWAKDGRMVVFGMDVLSPHTGYGYIAYDGEKVIEFHEKPDREQAKIYYESGSYLWNSGNFIFSAGEFLNELKNNCPELYQACQSNYKKIQSENQNVYLSEEVMRSMPAISVENAIFEKTDKLYVIKAAFHWWDMGNMEILASYMKEQDKKRVVDYQGKNVTVINQTQQQLVVANTLEDIAIINTDDVCYVMNKNAGADIKTIMKEYPVYESYYEKSNTVYRPWGKYEVLNFTENYKVKKVHVYPGHALTAHKHAHRSEQWSVVQGTATVTLDGETREYPLYSSVSVPVGADHMLANRGTEELVIMEVSFGPQITEEDKENVLELNIQNEVKHGIVKCEPIFKDNLWGGTKLRDVYHKKCDYDVIAESWELSAHEDGQCRIAEGEYKGMIFGEYLRMIGAEALGWKCQAFEKFPLLIKFIDAKKKLSLQVHPDDAYALPNENEYGKNEMWYVVDCEEGASLYYGLNQTITKEELKKRVENNTLQEVLNKIEVHPGDTFFVEAGTIHAIGEGILICEIQQSSNCTYRLYDYGRRDKFGNLRELHLKQALDVANCEKNPHTSSMAAEWMETPGGRERILSECKYFKSVLYETEDALIIPADDASFSSVIVLDGEGTITVGADELKFAPADSFFIHAGKDEIKVNGRCRLILTRL